MIRIIRISCGYWQAICYYRFYHPAHHTLKRIVINSVCGLPVGDLMKEDNKTKKQLLHELTELRSQNAALKKSITGSTWAEVAAVEASRYAESILETVRGPLLVLDADLKIISANRNFYSTFKVIPGETIGSFIYNLGNKQWDIPKLRELLEEVLPEKQAFDDFEVVHDFQEIGHKIMLLNACRIYRKDIGANMILLAIIVQAYEAVGNRVFSD
jgi:PAS domain-containing protein